MLTIEISLSLFEASINDNMARMSQGGNEGTVYIIKNSSCFTFEIVYINKEGIESAPIFLSPGNNDSKHRIFHDFPKVIVKNIHIAPGKSLEINQ